MPNVPPKYATAPLDAFGISLLTPSGSRIDAFRTDWPAHFSDASATYGDLGGHQKSLAMLPFDRVCNISYPTLI